MPEYGVWLATADFDLDDATNYGPGATPPTEEEAEPQRLTWRGTAASREQAVQLARAAWEERFGAPPLDTIRYVLEIEPGDAGYRG